MNDAYLQKITQTTEPAVTEVAVTENESILTATLGSPTDINVRSSNRRKTNSSGNKSTNKNRKRTKNRTKNQSTKGNNNKNKVIGK